MQVSSWKEVKDSSEHANGSTAKGGIQVPKLPVDLLQPSIVGLFEFHDRQKRLD